MPEDDEARSLFREEAVEYYAQRGPGRLLRVSTIWSEWGYWSFLVLIAAGLAASLLIHVGSDPLLFALFPPLHDAWKHIHG